MIFNQTNLHVETSQSNVIQFKFTNGSYEISLCGETSKPHLIDLTKLTNGIY